MEAKSELIDHYFKYWEKLKTYFFMIDRVITSSQALNHQTRVMASVKVSLDSREIIYGRVADTVFNGLETCGGFYESIIHIGMIFVFFF
jgi:hypothetical protein